MKRPFQIILTLVIFSSCHKDKSPGPAVDFGYNYFPTEIGRYAIYEVDSIAYDDQVHTPDTTKYLLKEQIVSVSPDNSGRPTMRIERYFKMFRNGAYDSAWSGPRIWTANKTSTTLERKEENVTYLKLIFPARKGKTWNGNTYNSYASKEYEITYADQKETINSLSFDSVLMVKQYEQIDVIENIFWAEKYSRNVGLVYKQKDSIYTGGTLNKSGYTFTQKIISYGK